MTNDEVYSVLKKEGIRQAVRGYISNVPDDNWMITTKQGSVFLLNDYFFTKYSLNPIFQKEDNGQSYFKEWQTWRYPKAITRRRIKERAQQ